MKKRHTMIALFISSASLLSAETNALIEVKLFKDWIIKNDKNFGNLAITNSVKNNIALLALKGLHILA
jgi:hypothetical protein